MILFRKLLISCFDLITDVLVLKEFINTGSPIASVQGVSLGVAMLMQALMSIVMGQPFWVALCGLLGLKPALESWRTAIEASPFVSQKWPNSNMLFSSRIIEILCEAIPQGIIQSLALILYSDERRLLQFISLGASFLATDATVVFSDREMDMSKLKRKTDPMFRGYVPEEDNMNQGIASVIFFTSDNALKVFAISMLIVSSSGMHAMGLFVFESLGMFMWRAWYGNWRFFVRGAGGA